MGIISEADGSCKFGNGETSVVASVYGPQTPRFMRHEEYDTATLEVEYRLVGGIKSTSSSSGGITFDHQEREGAKYLKQALLGAIDRRSFPRMLILIRVSVLLDDGGSLATALNACSLAIVDAGIPMHYVPCAVTIAILPTSLASLLGANAEGKGEDSSWCLDPNKEMEEGATAQCIFTLVPAQSTSEATLLTTKITGEIQNELFVEAIKFSLKASEHLARFFRQSN